MGRLSPPQMGPEELLRACAAGGRTSEDAWREFMRRYNQSISLAVVRTAAQHGQRSKDVIEDIIQDVYWKLCDRKYQALRAYRHDRESGDLAYLTKIASNTTHAYFHKRGAKVNSIMVPLEATEQNASHHEPMSRVHNELNLERNIQMKEIDVALRKCVSATTAKRDRSIFWLYYWSGWTARELAHFPWVPPLSEKGVEALLLRLGRAIRGRLGSA